MPKLECAKLTRETNSFNLNQKVWLVQLTGSCAAKVVGKWRGKGHYVTGWIHWDAADAVAPRFIEADVTDQFHKKIISIGMRN